MSTAWRHKIGQRVAELRRQKGYSSQDSLATTKGVHRTRISEVESGSRNYTIKSLIEVLAALDVDVFAFFGGSGKKHSKIKIEHEVIHDKLQELLDAGGDPAAWITGNISVFHAHGRKRDR